MLLRQSCVVLALLFLPRLLVQAILCMEALQLTFLLLADIAVASAFVIRFAGGPL
jgi:hypothetical protein